MTSAAKTPYAGHRFPPELISYTVWLYYRFSLSLRMVEEMLAFRGIVVSHETIRQWGLSPKGNAEGVYFGQAYATVIRRRFVDLIRRSIAECLMGPSGVVALDPAADVQAGLGTGGVGAQIYIFIFQAAPQALHETMIHAATFAVHADPVTCRASWPKNCFQPSTGRSGGK
jgi:hypothetical protein